MTLIPAAAICRANSLPIPDEAPVTRAPGRIAVYQALFSSCSPFCRFKDWPARRAGNDRELSLKLLHVAGPQLVAPI